MSFFFRTDPLFVVDRAARNQAAKLLRQYIHEEIDPYDFENQLLEITTDDPVIERIHYLLWGHFDDKLIQEPMDKQEWDFLQRLLLVLASDHFIIPSEKWHWHVTNLIAGSLLLGFLYCCWFYWGTVWLALYYIAMGFGSFFISTWRENHFPFEIDERQMSLTPFGSLAEVRCTLKSVPTFVKEQFPGEPTLPSESSDMDEGMTLQGALGWAIATPLVLIFQTFFPVSYFSHYSVRSLVEIKDNVTI